MRRGAGDVFLESNLTASEDVTAKRICRIPTYGITQTHSYKDASHPIRGIEWYDTYCRSFEQKRYAFNLRDPILLHFQTSPESTSAQICALIRDNLRETLLPAAICEETLSLPNPQPTSLPHQTPSIAYPLHPSAHIPVKPLRTHEATNHEALIKTHFLPHTQAHDTSLYLRHGWHVD